ncbi:hypothetical protein [Streptomyces syringium]|uniref:hypothetical protein n=1 Tax=Streptomyces syringium TaxID=76729 RepID=UPI00345510AC
MTNGAPNGPRMKVRLPSAHPVPLAHVGGPSGSSRSICEECFRHAMAEEAARVRGDRIATRRHRYAKLRHFRAVHPGHPVNDQ